MYVSVNKPETEPEKYILIDVESGCRIPFVQEANDETGEFSCYLRDGDGNYIAKQIKNDNIYENDLTVFKFKGNIKLQRIEEDA